MIPRQHRDSSAYLDLFILDRDRCVLNETRIIKAALFGQMDKVIPVEGTRKALTIQYLRSQLAVEIEATRIKRGDSS